MEEERFVGYHGTTSTAVAAILQGISPPVGQNYQGRTQLGAGFYTTGNYDAALEFAENAAVKAGGDPVVLKVYAHNFRQMEGREVPSRLWWDIPADSPYIQDFDYLTAEVTGYEPVRQIKFNPRAYGALTVRW